MPVHTKYVSIELTYALRRCVIAPAHWGVPHRIPHGVRCSIISRAFLSATHWSSTNINPNSHNYLYPDVRQNRSLRKPSPVHPPVRARKTSPCAGVLSFNTHPLLAAYIVSFHHNIHSKFSLPDTQASLGTTAEEKIIMADITSRGIHLFICIIAFTVICIIILLLRFWAARLIRRSFYLDDFAIVFAFVSSLQSGHSSARSSVFSRRSPKWPRL